MDLGIAGNAALVLAASSGIGRGVALSLAREGVKVAITARSGENAEKVAAEIRANGGQAIGLSWDLADLSVIDGRVAQVERELGPIDILFNNTGGPPPTPAAGQSQAVWTSHFQSMVLSVIAITDAILPGMRERGWGRIITTTSSGVLAPIPGLAISNTLRASLVGWSKSLAGEVGGNGITVNVMVPGRIVTKRSEDLEKRAAESEGVPVAQIVARRGVGVPLGRHGDPQEYGDVAAFLASTRASYVTGSVVRVDGGAIPSV